MKIERDTYLQQLIDAKGNGMIKVITGIRRCGKSYLLFHLFYDHLIQSGVKADHILRFAFDSQDDLIRIGEDFLDLNIRKRKVDPHKFLSYIQEKIIDQDTYYILLDEIQFLGSFEAVLNGFLRKENLDIYVTGSNAKFLSKDVITEFRGRGWEIPISPLTFKEFRQVFEGTMEEAYRQYTVYGGLPKVVECKTEAEKARYLTSVLSETYLKDIIDRNKIVKVDELGELLDILASSVGSLTNPTKLANTFQSIKKVNIHPETIRKYMDYFSDSFLISIPKRYDITGKRYINSPVKCYFSDLGLRNARLNFRELEQPRLMENVVYNELVNRGYHVDVGALELYEQNSKGKSVLKNTEVDFVCNQSDKRYYVQVAYALEGEEKIAQEQRPLLHTQDGFKKIIIVKDGISSHYNQDGILLIKLYDFLMNEDIFNY